MVTGIDPDDVQQGRGEVTQQDLVRGGRGTTGFMPTDGQGNADTPFVQHALGTTKRTIVADSTQATVVGCEDHQAGSIATIDRFQESTHRFVHRHDHRAVLLAVRDRSGWRAFINSNRSARGWIGVCTV